MAKKPERQATRLLNEHGIDSVPIEVGKIAEDLGIQVNFERLDSEISGLMLFENGTTKVAINETHHRNRQRFTLGHEIGHLILHTSNENKVFVDRRFFRNAASSSGELKEEVDATAFAAALLMPKKFIRKHINSDDSLTDIDVCRLATKFEVSEQAMTLRLLGLGYIEPD